MEPKAIVLHVSASTWGTRDDIDRWHRSRGWSGIGYHRVILNGFPRPDGRYRPDLDGLIQTGRADSVEGAHCRAGGMNALSLGVCLIGNPGWAPEGPEYMAGGLLSPSSRPYLTRRQYEALVGALARLCRRHGIDPSGTIRHNGRKVFTISQHSDHDRGKPLCASLRMGRVRADVARLMGGG